MDKPKRLTDEQIRETVKRMKLSDELKEKMLHRCLVLNDSNSRFVVYSRWLQKS